MAARRVCAVLTIGLLLAAAVAAVPPHLQLVTDTTDGGLSLDFHAASCPQLEGIVRAAVQAERGRDVQVTAGLLRIFFHDCLPQVVHSSYSFRYKLTKEKRFCICMYVTNTNKTRGATRPSFWTARRPLVPTLLCSRGRCS
jgi:hypothetical protein